jgi:hypothetical protein
MTMSFTYEISFNISRDGMDQLALGNALERGLGYLRTLLPSEPGFVFARAMYSLTDADETHVVFQSVWDNWEDLLAHRETYVEEKRFLTSEFEPHLNLADVRVNYYQEVA